MNGTVKLKTQLATDKPLTVAVLAMGGQGGGVLADWIVGLAEDQGWMAQSTSVPGVAQRTGATIYYIEMLPARDGSGTDLLAHADPRRRRCGHRGRIDGSWAFGVARPCHTGSNHPDCIDSSFLRSGREGEARRWHRKSYRGGCGNGLRSQTVIAFDMDTLAAEWQRHLVFNVRCAGCGASAVL